jgi:hypothetical protein
LTSEWRDKKASGRLLGTLVSFKTPPGLRQALTYLPTVISLRRLHPAGAVEDWRGDLESSSVRWFIPSFMHVHEASAPFTLSILLNLCESVRVAMRRRPFIVPWRRTYHTTHRPPIYSTHPALTRIRPLVSTYRHASTIFSPSIGTSVATTHDPYKNQACW